MNFKFANHSANVLISNLHSCRRRKDRDTLRLILNGNPFTVVDVGASGGLQSRWKRFSSIIDFWMVEPDSRSQQGLISVDLNHLEKNKRYIPYALSDHVGYLALFLTCDPQKTSQYLPNYRLVQQFPNSNHYDVVDKIEIECTTLDQVVQENQLAIDFLKIDTQGSELSILRGSTRSLKGILGVEVEVEFAEVYEHQPLFSDVAVFMEQHGFEILDFVYLSHWDRSKFTGLGKLMFGDAVFIQKAESVVEMALENGQCINIVRRYIGLLFVYRQYDSILHFLQLCVSSSIVSIDDARSIKKLIIVKQKKLLRLQRYVNFLNRVINEDSRTEPASPRLTLNV